MLCKAGSMNVDAWVRACVSFHWMQVLREFIAAQNRQRPSWHDQRRDVTPTQTSYVINIEQDFRIPTCSYYDMRVNFTQSSQYWVKEIYLVYRLSSRPCL